MRYSSAILHHFELLRHTVDLASLLQLRCFGLHWRSVLFVLTSNGCLPISDLCRYDMRELISTLCDVDSVLEIRPEFGVGIITCLVRVVSSMTLPSVFLSATSVRRSDARGLLHGDRKGFRWGSLPTTRITLPER